MSSMVATSLAMGAAQGVAAVRTGRPTDWHSPPSEVEEEEAVAVEVQEALKE